MVCTSLLGTARAEEVEAARREPVNIPAAPLDIVLKTLTQQSGVRIVFLAEDVKELNSQGARGNLTLEEALGNILSGTGLGFRFLNARTVAIGPDKTQINVNTGGRNVTKARTWSAVSSAAGLCGSILLTNQAVCAEDTAQQADTLQEVVVTAERREQDLQKTSVAVSVREGSDLQEQGRFSTRQILEDVPSVSIAPTGALGANDSPATAISIRGVKTNGGIAGSSASIVASSAYYVDGVINGIGGNYDIGQIQVLRGPQGTLYGRSATAGAVIVSTASPELDKFGVNAAVEYGNFNLRHSTAAINLGGEKLGVRVSANSYQRSGYYAPVGDQVKTYDGRIKLLYKPNENVTLQLGFAYQDNYEFGGELAGRLIGKGNDAISYEIKQPLGSGKDTTRQYWGQLDWDLGAMTLTYIPALREFKQQSSPRTVNGSGFAISSELNINSDPFLTHELRLSSNSTMPFQWQTGLFYYNNNMKLTSYGYVIGPPFPAGFLLFAAQPQTRLTRNIGVFAEGTYSFDDTMRLTAGIRGDDTKVVNEQQSCEGTAALPLVCIPANLLTAEQGTRKWKNFTYKLRLEKDVTPSSLAYVSLSSAFLPGDVAMTTGANGRPTAAPYDAETLTALEIGSKNRFLGDRLQLNGAAYYYRYGGHQLPVVIGQIGGQGGPTLFQTQVSPARMIGAEVELLFKPNANNDLGLNVSFTDAYYVNKPPLFAAGVQNSHFSGVIPWQVNPSFTHNFSLPRDQKLSFRADAQFRSSFLPSNISVANYNAGLEPYVWNGNSLVTNFSLTYNVLPQATLSAYVRNAFDQVYKTNVGITSTVVTGNGGSLSDPRQFGVVLSMRL